MRHLLTLAARLGLHRTAASAALLAAGLLASAPGYTLAFCDAKTPCAAGTQCFGWMCVPTASVCNPAAPACASWQTCDMTCKVMGSSTPGSGGTTTVDAGSSGGSSGSGSSGGGSGAVPPAADGGSSSDPMPPAPDASSPDDAQSPMPEIDGGPLPPPPDCPKDVGLCLADPAKITVQAGCQEFCDAALKCGGMGGGGSSGSDPGEPAPSVDGGSTEPMPAQDAGSADAGSGFAADTAEGKVPPPDGGAQAPDPLEVKACLNMCSVIKLNGAGKAEFDAALACIAKNSADCKAIESGCAAQLDAFEKVIDKDASLQLALMGVGFGGGSSRSGGGGIGEPTKGDAESQNSSSDAGSSGDSATGGGAPRNPDAGASDGSLSADTSTSGGKASTASSDDGCSAGPSASQPGALGLLVMGLFALLRRRRQPQG